MKTIKELKLIALTVLLAAGFAACSKSEDKKTTDPSAGKSCFTCKDCEGQYGHLMNKQYCVDGFDSREDWLDAKRQREENNNCACAFD